MIESLIRRVPVTTQTFDRIRLFQNESKVSDAFLASHRKLKDKERKNMHVLALHVSDVAFKFSPLRRVSSFWLSAEHLV